MSEFPFAVVARIPGLTIRLVFSALRFKRKVKKSTKKLRKGLRKGGMSKERANELAQKYEESLSIRNFFRNAIGDSDLPFFSNFMN